MAGKRSGRDLVTRQQLQRALAVNAATAPLPIAVGAAVVVAAIVIGASWLIAVAVVAYVALALMTFFDENQASRVGKHVYGRRETPTGALEPRRLAPPIRRFVEAAHSEQASITKTITDSDLSWADVRDEVAALVRALEAAATRAQRLYDYLQTQDRSAVAQRAADRGRAGDSETADALGAQLAQLDRLAAMLNRAYSEMEQVNAALQTVHARLVGAAVSSEASRNAEIAGDVRELRSQVETLTDDLADTDAA